MTLASSTLFVSSAGLEHAKHLVSQYKQGQINEMTPETWKAKKIIDSTLHPGTSIKWKPTANADSNETDTGEPVFLPFRMSCFVFANLVVTAGMLSPGLSVRDLTLSQDRETTTDH